MFVCMFACSHTYKFYRKKKVGSVTGHHLHLTTLNATLLGEIQSSCSRQMAVAV